LPASAACLRAIRPAISTCAAVVIGIIYAGLALPTAVLSFGPRRPIPSVRYGITGLAIRGTARMDTTPHNLIVRATIQIETVRGAPRTVCRVAGILHFYVQVMQFKARLSDSLDSDETTGVWLRCAAQSPQTRDTVAAFDGLSGIRQVKAPFQNDPIF